MAEIIELIMGIEFIMALLIIIGVGITIGMGIEHWLNERKIAKLLCLECWTIWNEES